MIDIKLRKRLKEEVARETGPMRALKVLQYMHDTAAANALWDCATVLKRGMAEVQEYIAEDAKHPSYQSDREAIERITVQRDNAERLAGELHQQLEEARAAYATIMNRLETLKEQQAERITPSNAAGEDLAALLDEVSSERNAAIRRCDELRAELEGKKADCAIAEKAYEDLHARHEDVVRERNKLRDQLSIATNAEALAPEPPASLKALVERWRLLSHQRRLALHLGDGDTTDFAQCAAELEDVLAKKKLLLTSIYNPRVQADLETMRKRAESAEQTLQLIKDNLP